MRENLVTSGQFSWRFPYVAGMNPPRVVHLTTVHRPFDPRIFWKEAVSVCRAGYDVRLVAQHTRAETVEGVPIVPLRLVEGRYRRIVLQREVFAAARALQAQVYHVHDPELIPVAYALKRTTGARVIYDMHEDYRGHGAVEGRLLRLLERWCFRWVDHVVVANETHAAIVKGAPVTWIANYVNAPPRAPSPTIPRSRDAEIRLLYTGVIADQRGLPALLDLAEVILQKNLPWRIDLVGICYRAEDRRRAERRIEKGGLDRVVRRVGWETYVPWQAMTPFYEAAHVGLALWAPHRNHASKIPTKFYEYLHFGLPILCSDFPRWRAFVDDQACGAVVDPHAAAVVRRLSDWFEKPEHYARLVAGAAVAAPRYQWSVMEGRLLDLYARLLEPA